MKFKEGDKVKTNTGKIGVIKYISKYVNYKCLVAWDNDYGWYSEDNLTLFDEWDIQKGTKLWIKDSSKEFVVLESLGQIYFLGYKDDRIMKMSSFYTLDELKNNFKLTPC